MKKQTLAPAVLASLTAAGLVLAPAAAHAQDSDAQNVTLSDSAADPTATPTQEPEEKQQTQAEAPAEEEPSQNEETPEEPEEPSSPQPSDDSTSDEPTDGATETEAPTEEPTEDPTEDADTADVTVTPQDVGLTDVVYVSGDEAPSGATITGTELEPETQYTVTVTGGPETSGERQVTTSADGSFTESYTIEVDSDADLESFAGDRSVSVTDSEGVTVDEGSFEILNDIEDDETDEDEEDEEVQADPALDLPNSIEVDDVMVPQGEEPGDRGLQIAATDLAPGEWYTFRVIAPDDTPDLSTEFEVEADEDGNAVGAYFIEWYGDYSADVIAGTFTIELAGEDVVLDSADVEFTVGSEDDDSDDGDDSDEGEDGGDGSDDGDESDDSDDGQPGEDDGDDSDEADLDPAITVSPETLSAASFMDYDTGVQVTASNCLPGDMVSLEVMWPGTDEVAYADGIEADDDGAASFSFYGTGSNAADYVGTWNVSISCGGETATDSFTVTGDAGDDGDSGSELPRTGSDAGILAIAAAGLLTVGAATVMLSSRPKRRDTF
ncbi:MAG: hypothetical protein ACTH08_04470 [Brevibacterium yomogidense]